MRRERVPSQVCTAVVDFEMDEPIACGRLATHIHEIYKIAACRDHARLAEAHGETFKQDEGLCVGLGPRFVRLQKS